MRANNGIDSLDIEIISLFLAPAVFIVVFKLYFFFNILHNKKTSDLIKEFVAILIPEENLNPSSIIHIASANGVKYCSIQNGKTFLPFI
jgi:hypothetical protein